MSAPVGDWDFVFLAISSTQSLHSAGESWSSYRSQSGGSGVVPPGFVKLKPPTGLAAGYDVMFWRAPLRGLIQAAAHFLAVGHVVAPPKSGMLVKLMLMLDTPWGTYATMLAVPS